MVETFFAQMCDLLNLRRNYAKNLRRISSKINIETIIYVNPTLD